MLEVSDEDPPEPASRRIGKEMFLGVSDATDVVLDRAEIREPGGYPNA